jgi:molybdenum cofactor biosynthesis protein B
MGAVEQHRSKSPKTLKISVMTASTSRYVQAQKGEEVVDDSGMTAVNLLKDLGYEVEYLGIVNDDVAMIREKLFDAISQGSDVVIITGGTGLSRRDLTIEAVKPLLEKEIEGFGEILRIESYKRIGPPAAMTRATAGAINKKIVIALPGSPDAVKLAVEIFGKELPHFVYIARS